ncbi:MAG TPA: NAD(P)H-hydrate dehydratase [Coriobacteriia bacterium]|nr:NAD(P)H-hydrate dehydratase [Coriobacteriia bacterium]
MLRALTAEQSRAAEQQAVATYGVSLLELMERAGEAVADEVEARFPVGSILVMAGPGNNGGDGWVAARVLHESGREVSVITLRRPEDLSGESAESARAAAAAGVRWLASEGAEMETLRSASVVVDALLGTGSRLPLEGAVAQWCRGIADSGVPVISVDVPTGVDSDSGAVDDSAVIADLTVTFTSPKLGVVTYPGAARVGELIVADIGIDPAITNGLSAPEVWTDDDYAALLPIPEPMTHKNERGRVLVVAGSGRYPGAAILAARGAMRSGAGYVTLAVPDSIVQIAQCHLLAAPVVGLPSGRSRTLSSSAASEILSLAAEYDAVVLGPGLTLSDGSVATVRSLVAKLTKPLVIDADALNALVDAHELIEQRTADTVLTPHPGELARLLGESVSRVQADRVFSSSRLAGPRRAVVLKGAGTVVSDVDRQVIITAGTPALATAGTGDVLSGVIGALLAQGLAPLEAGALGAYLHARAGEEAAGALTPMCVTAEDVPDYLPAAVRELLTF